jgi:hypothetical protein
MSDLAGTADVIANVDGEDNYVRIQVPTNAGALDGGKQLAVVDRQTPSPPTPLVTRRLPAGHGCCSPRSWAGWVSAGTRTRTTCWWLPPGRRWGCHAVRDPGRQPA